ncbi:hypothetical protein R3P38DRAFT_2762751 [Favolaschia claudopus]|uniref:Uncharacterized protein n=1 Tax=Favolaschia claudopus TaxID=2862362 RepID=A0AAW0DMQ7_9AGAR
MAILASTVLNRLAQHPQLQATLQFDQINRFLRFTGKLWPEIIADKGIPPEQLPSHITGFLSAVLSVDPTIILLSWLAFGDLVQPIHLNDSAALSDDDLFRQHGAQYKIGL